MDNLKLETAYWAGRLLGFKQSWDVAQEIVEALNEAKSEQLTIPDVSYCSCNIPDIVSTVHPLPDICNYCRKAIKE